MVRPLLLAAVLFVTGGAARDAGTRGAGGLLLVVNKGDQTLGIIDPVAGRQVATVKESGVTGHEVIASPDGRTAYVPIYGDSGVGKPGTDGRTVDVIDIATRRRVATIDLGSAERPHCPQFGPDGRLYVSTEITRSLTVIDPATRAVLRKIETGQPESHMFAITRDGTRAFTSNVHPGTVTAIDLASGKALATISVSPYAQRIALSVDDRRAFTADQAAPRLAVIDTVALTVERFVTLPGPAYGMAPTPDGRFLVMALPTLGQVGVLDLATMELTRRIDVPRSPQFVLVRPDGRMAYVSCDASGQVAAIDLQAWTVERIIDAGPMADGLAWAAGH